jgi:SAM-dependent methyltransferase
MRLVQLKRRLVPMGSVMWEHDVAEVYDQTYRAKFEPSVLDPIVDLLAGLAGGGPALEFAVGTGRVALPLSARGIAVHGLELSPHMAAQLRAKPGADSVPVTIGDMTTTRVPGAPFTLVYLVANTILNVTTQDAQLAVFANAAAQLEPGGCFVVEVIVPQLRRVPPGETARVFTLDPDHVGIETFDDVAGQIAWSHHWIEVGGRLVRHSAPYRYVWPSELDLMARSRASGSGAAGRAGTAPPLPPAARARSRYSRRSPETRSPAGRHGTRVPLRQDAADPGFHAVPAGPAQTDREADGAGGI